MFIKSTSCILLVCKAFTHKIKIYVFYNFQKMPHFAGRYLKWRKSLRDFCCCLQITYDRTSFVERIKHVEVVGFWQSIFKNLENIVFYTIFQK